MVASWQALCKQQAAQLYYQQLQQFIALQRAQGKVIYPPDSEVFTAFDLTPLDKVKVVILGQDPYHGPNQAHGLSFSVKKGVKPPPSLANIYKELSNDIEGFTIPLHGDLSTWARQGVLLLNTVLTVEQGAAHSHAKAGWETFTDEVLNVLNQQNRPIIFVLWGNHAIQKGRLINAKHHTVLSGPHPSPLSAYRGFFGCQHFSKINKILHVQGDTQIDWQV
ncbi:uracil-DNA glycosylase [Shewanella inventionis]|uniref:Uracil-DNA glycosylase n=1 Tax=Shewanella inventionis TaxID=1738770 RepID=A0ABQ1J6K5_9GAMM|nr:uracil-DNA glycosylase [Shewanella inventionis]MCL1158714.1 uracil-DNA glycosylase [Shewanella inventionis]UAL42901.1 uracil-DNA glycosylase [Shewanella inventionis]GGB61254.1 uracil-DNA glycosylase [Shewanella inventionis]